MRNDDINSLAKKVNINLEELKTAAQNGNVNDFIDKKLSPSASKKLKEVLSDKNATNQLLSTPQAKALLEKLLDK